MEKNQRSVDKTAETQEEESLTVKQDFWIIKLYTIASISIWRYKNMKQCMDSANLHRRLKKSSDRLC